MGIEPSEDSGKLVIEGYAVAGPRTNVISTGTIFVRRSTMRGRPWLRFVKKTEAAGYWVSAYKTKREAMAGQ
jgi:hypothetical protein